MKKLIHLDKKLDMSGPEGNAFFILGQVNSWLKQCGVSSNDMNTFREEATSGDYEHLKKTVTDATGVTFFDSFEYDDEEYNEEYEDDE